MLERLMLRKVGCAFGQWPFAKEKWPDSGPQITQASRGKAEASKK